MVDFSPDFVINSTLFVGTIFKFDAPELIETTIPHYFIVVAIEDSNNYLVLCTTQKDKKIKYFDNNNLDYSGLVFIKPDSKNGLPADSYVNCNDYYTITKSSLIKKLSLNSLSFTGSLSLDHYIQIKDGIVSSVKNDLPEFLLKHPEE